MKRLDRSSRLRLLEFVCSFAWTDLEVTDAERAVVSRLVDRFEFDQEERRQVARWLESPPPAEDVDPLEIPAEHRSVFLDAVREVVGADGVSQAEAETLALFEELVSD